KSTSNPAHSRFADCAEKPSTPWLTPHVTTPRFLIVLSVCECAVPAAVMQIAAAQSAAALLSRGKENKRRIRPLTLFGVVWTDFSSLQVWRLQHHNAGAYRHTFIEIGHFRIRQPETSRGHRRSDRPGLVGAVNPINRSANVKRARAQRIARATRHEARQIRLTSNHLGGWRPVRPFGLPA